ncbi:MAG: endonuclease V, partial [Bacteroidetes bacterium]
MILAFDSYYVNNEAHTACIAFEQWTDETPAQVYTEITPETAEYEPGAFYKRELPGILSLLKQIETAQVSHIVIDGFVVLDDAGKPGLGAHLYASLGQKIPVIGVAKNNFALLQARKRELFRGNSRKPLYI